MKNHSSITIQMQNQVHQTWVHVLQTIKYMATRHSSSHLWVISCYQIMPCVKNFHQLIIQLVHDLPSLVTGQHLWQPLTHEDLEICKKATKIAFCLMICINDVANIYVYLE